MRRKIAIFGAVLIVVAFAILTIFIIAPALIMPLDNAPLIKDIMQVAVCRSDEVLTAGYSTFETPGTTSTSIDYNCVDKQQNERDVGDQIIEAAGIGYVVIFLAGLFTFMYGMQGDKKTSLPSAAAASEKPSGSDTPFTSSGLGYSPAQNPPEHIPLAQHLQELKDALHQGLITDAEYKARRRELLDQK